MLQRTKTFQETRYYERPPGAPPDQWRSTGKDTPLDEQVGEWVEQTGAAIISASAPGFAHYWLDSEKTRKCVLVGVVVIYKPKEGSNEQSRPAERPELRGDPTPVEPGELGPARTDLPTNESGGFRPA